MNRITAERESGICFPYYFVMTNEKMRKLQGKKKTQKIEYPKTIELYIVNVIISFKSGRNGSWWERRTRLERRLSLCATVVVFVAVGLAIAMAALIYRGQQNDPSKGLT